MYKHIIKPLLFSLDAERAHHFTMDTLRIVQSIPGALFVINQLYGVKARSEMSVDLGGVHFPNPVGLAAGLDKNGQALPAFSTMGFGFMEVGTVTPKAQPGNEQPRMFRLPEDLALINRMGFNNKGTDALVERLRNFRKIIPIAVNIGKNKITPNDQAEKDYRECIRSLYDYGDLFVVNISSPNTLDLRSLQHGNELKGLLDAVMDEMKLQQTKPGTSLGRPKPVFVKLAPDLTDTQLDDTLGIIVESGVFGVIAANTTVDRTGIKHKHALEMGGLSGKPLGTRSTEMIRRIYRLTQGKLPIIGSGGIFSSEDAYGKIRAGASLVEIFTAMIYHGPG
ncbi:MAG TPA: quinone-dependent dihydroorotate dehydrogenase, partial [Bacilli bacterium]